MNRPLRDTLLTLAALLLLAGCSKPSPPRYDRTRAEVLWRLFDTLARGESEQALRQIARLRSLTQPEPFYRQAEEHEGCRRPLREAVQSLHHGRPERALTALRELRRRAPDSAIVERAVKQSRALLTLRNAAEALPADWADQQRKQLDALAPHTAILSVSPSFRSWYAEQKAFWRRLVLRERVEALRQLRGELDLALVSHRGIAPLVLAQLAAADPEARAHLAPTGEGHPPRPPSPSLAPLDSALALLGPWNRIGESESKPKRARTAWRAERLHAAITDAHNGDWRRVFRRLEALRIESPLDGHYSKALAASYLSVGRDADRSPGVSPCPSVPEVLRRIAIIVQ